MELTPKQVKEGWSLGYADVVSEYSTVMNYTEMPSGVPEIQKEIIIGHEACAIFLKGKCGFAEVDVIPPKNLIHPVLPERRNGKLSFNLLPKTKQVYTIVELNAAIKRGNKITKINEAHLYTGRKDMFKSFIKCHLQGKLEASGAKTGEELSKFKAYCLEKYDITIEITEDNAGRRQICKLILNSSWGKFAQRLNQTKEEYVDPKQWFDLLQKHKDGDIIIQNERLVDDKLWVSYTCEDDSENGAYKNNVAMAAYVTAQGRLWLYKGLEAAGVNALACDTDSVMYIKPPGFELKVIFGDGLGEWEREFAGKSKEKDHNGRNKDLVAIGFVSTGPKSYAWRFLSVADNDKLAAKGITLNKTNLESVNYDSMKKLVTGQIRSVAGLLGPAMKRCLITETQGTSIINSDHQSLKKNDKEYGRKTLRITNDKRTRPRLNAGKYFSYFYLPFGHIDA